MATQTVSIQEGSGPLVTPLPFSDAEYQRRLDGVRAQMADKGLDAFVSFTPENIYYLSAHDTPGYYFGTSTGQVYASADDAEHWSEIASYLPAISSVEVAIVD